MDSGNFKIEDEEMVRKVIRFAWIVLLMCRWNMKLGNASMLQNAFATDYRNHRLQLWKIYSIHRKGFTVSDWCFMDLEEKDYAKYMSNVQYCKMHPINGRYSAWIDDKLTLKYLCAGTVLDTYMPEYYFQIDASGRLMQLVDYKKQKAHVTVEDVAELLEEKEELAIKLIAGAIGQGFYKAEFINGNYCLNGEILDKKDFCERIAELRDYIIIEYLHPHKEIAKFCPSTVNSIRYLVGRIDGRLEMIKGYIRFGTKGSGFVENYNAGGVLCYLDKDGNFVEGNIIDRERNKNVVVEKHPDSGVILKDRIPLWDEIVKASQLFDRVFPQLDYLGIDFVVTSKGKVKILEVNSLTSLDGLQMKDSILETEASKFFKKRMK